MDANFLAQCAPLSPSLSLFESFVSSIVDYIRRVERDGRGEILFSLFPSVNSIDNEGREKLRIVRVVIQRDGTKPGRKVRFCESKTLSQPASSIDTLIQTFDLFYHQRPIPGDERMGTRFREYKNIGNSTSIFLLYDQSSTTCNVSIRC